MSNARLTYSGRDDSWSVAAWVRNFTDETYKLYSLDLGDLGVTTFYGPPIMYGVNLRLSFQ